MTLRPLHWRYCFDAYRALPVTFVRRVLFGRDPYWRRYFWSRWGFLPRPLVERARGRHVLWIDALSGGEATQIVTFCRMLRRALPDWLLVLSTNNRYSFEFAQTNLDLDEVFDTPWDMRGPAARAVRALRPRAFVSVQNMICPVLVREARRHGATTILVSGLMSHDVDQHPMYHRTMQWRPFEAFDWIGAWAPDDVEGFVCHGADRSRVMVTGNMKFEAAHAVSSAAARDAYRGALGLGPRERVLLAASIHPGEEEIAAAAFLRVRPAVHGLRLILVPRYAFDVPAMTRRLVACGLPYVLRSQLDGRPQPADRVIVIDTFGELPRLYAIAAVVFLGGTTYARNRLGLGQNPIEPLVHRVPFFFGRYLRLWEEIAAELRAVWPGFQITTADDLAAGVQRLLADPDLAARADAAMLAILERHRDDVDRNVQLVLRAVGHQTRVAASSLGVA